ncbi:MAG: hypothetical protein GEU78_15085 [Actinobacteria bacterium]|nr:hypothetical protein [Actinomycetota bacterium]
MADFGHGFTVDVNNEHNHRTVLRSVATVETDDEAASFSCDRPDGVKPGDLLIAFHSADWGVESSMGPPVGGGTWTQVGNTETDGADNLHTKVWQRIAGDSEPDSYQFSQDPVADGVVAIAAVTWERVDGRGVLHPSPNLHPRKWAQTAVAVRRDVGWDLDLEALQVSSLALDSDVEGWASDVLMLGRGEDSEPTIARARELNVPYRNIHGDPAHMTLMSQESATEELTADQRAVGLLNAAQPTRRQVSLSVDDYDVDGDAKAGNLIGVYDPEEGLFDLSNPQQWRGHTIYPLELRVTQSSWPVVDGMGVYFRDQRGRVVDLTDYVETADGAATLTVGAIPRSFVGLERQTEALRSTLRLDPLYEPDPEPATVAAETAPTPRAALVRRLTTQNSAHAADTFVSFTSMPVGDPAMWTAGNPTRLFLPIPGLWEIHAGVTWDGSTAGARRLNIQRDDSTVIAEGRPGTSGVRHGGTCSTYMTSDGAQWVRLLAVQTSGGNLGIAGDERTFLTATFVRPL